MAHLHLSPILTETEWNSIKTDSINQFLFNKINSNFGKMDLDKICFPCTATKPMKIKNHYRFSLPENTIKTINCICDLLNITHTQLITRVVLYPAIPDLIELIEERQTVLVAGK